MIILVFLLASFFALNMGGASFGAAFATSYGTKIISKRRAFFYFIIFIILGSLIFGENVSYTLGQDLIPAEHFTLKTLIVIFLCAGLSMFTANLMKIPQTTSIVTVATICGVGYHFHEINTATLVQMIIFWVVSPILAFVLTRLIAQQIYPPRRSNFWFYEKFINHQSKLKKFVIATSCFASFSVGTNNVSNVVGPLVGFWEFSDAIETPSVLLLLLIFAVVYSLGGLIFTEPLKTAGKRFVPLGLWSATIISLVSGTLMIIASIYGIPQSFVMLQLAAILAISTVKQGSSNTFKNPMTLKSLFTWTINPLITFGITVLILKIFNS